MSTFCASLEGKTTEYPVIAIADEDIVDTNGAGDAFVGGKDNSMGVDITQYCWLFNKSKIYIFTF